MSDFDLILAGIPGGDAGSEVFQVAVSCSRDNTHRTCYQLYYQLQSEGVDMPLISDFGTSSIAARRAFVRRLRTMALATAALAAAFAGMPGSASGVLLPPGQEWTHAAAWGHNAFGQLGDGTQTLRLTPVGVDDPMRGFKRIAGGFGHSLAVAADGTVWSWGRNVEGQLGLGGGGDRSQPTQVPGLSNVKEVAAGSAYSLALRIDGTVWAWGENYYGQLGDGTQQRKYSPVLVPGLTGITKIAASAQANGAHQDHSLALRSDGTVWAWGFNNNGELGIGSTVTKVQPVQVVTMDTVVDIAAGGSHSLATRSDGSIWAWGSDSSGQLGDGGPNSSAVLAKQIAITGVVSISAGDDHSLAVRSDGTVWAWGDNSHGQLGDGTTTPRTLPTAATEVTDAAQVAAGAFYSVARTADGRVWTWGSNGAGQLGDPDFVIRRLIPAAVAGLSDVRRVSASLAHTMVIRAVARPGLLITVPMTSIDLTAGSSVTATVITRPRDGFTGLVMLTALGLPEGVTATISPAVVTAGYPATVTLTAAPKALSSTSSIVIAGTPEEPAANVATTFDLNVTAP